MYSSYIRMHSVSVDTGLHSICLKASANKALYKERVTLQDTALCQDWHKVVYRERCAICNLFSKGGNLSVALDADAWAGKMQRKQDELDHFRIENVNCQISQCSIWLRWNMLQFSRQCLMGHIHHYWVIARSLRVLRLRNRGEAGGEWVDVKVYRLKAALMKLFTNMWKCDIRRHVLYY